MLVLALVFIVIVIFAGLMIVSDRLTDRRRYTPCVTIGRIYVVLRCGGA